MKELAGFLLLKLGGNDSPDKAAITAALSAVGVEADAAKVDALLKELDGKDLEEMMETGKDLLATFGGGGGGGGGAGGAGGGGDAAEEVKEEEVEEEAPIGGGDMFGGDAGGGDY